MTRVLACTFLSVCVPTAVPAAVIRDYEAAMHDRFVGFPAGPSWNDAAWFGSRTYAGVGWWAQNIKYQLALVTPEHYLCASHARPGVGATVRFLDPDGQLVERTVLSVTMIPGANGGNTDVSLGRLSAAVGPEIGFFPYLNLPNEAAYPGTELIVFGWNAKVGGGVFDSYHEKGINGLGETRLFKFLYNEEDGNGDDIYLEGGDSGSPSFALAGGRPVIVGMHAAVGTASGTRVSYDTFIPHHVPQLNAVLDAQGYRMTSAYPVAVELDADEVPPPTLRRQRMPGSFQIELANLGPTGTGNVKLLLGFPPDAVPDLVTPAAGWVTEQAADGVWSLRRAEIDAGQAAAVTAIWAALPEAESLVVEAVHASDGSPLRSRLFEVDLAPSYKAWSKHLDDPDPAADADGDGIVNLLEYAFGGDPAGGAAEHGIAVLPVFSLENGGAVWRFPVRADAALRGISYVMEFSDALEEGSWSEAEPPGFSMGEDEIAPGFLLRVVTFDLTEPRMFCRVRVELDE